jgi:signal transduction histidine kinase
MPDESINFAEDVFGDTFRKLGDLEKSLEYYNKSIHSPELFLRFNGNLEIAKIYQSQSKIDSAFIYGKVALEVAEQSGFYSSIIEANTYLSQLSQLSDPAEGLKYAYQAMIYQDSLTAMERTMAISDFISIDRIQRKQELEQEIQASKTSLKIYALIGSSFTLIVIAFLLYINNRAQKKSNRKTEIAYERLQNTQSQLIHSEKMASLGELTAGIAHEIQNPLNFVNNFSDVNKELAEELMEEIKKGNGKEAKAILKDIIDNEEKILHHGKRADGIVKGMLQHSRGSSGEKELTDINELADEYLRLSYHGLRAKDKSFNADFKTELDPDLPKVNVVPQDIGRVLLNLINNAFYAVSQKAQAKSPNFKPEVMVSTELMSPSGGGKGEVKISIQDNGQGIPDDIKDKIFQPFFTTKPTGQGTGLGLSMSYDIVTKGHGGELIVESDQNGHTEFIIQIPTE